MATIMLKEYDTVDACVECVYFGNYEVPGVGTKDIRRFLASGDYSEGGSDRRVEVFHGDHHIGTWTAPEIRRIAAALRGAAKRAGKQIVTGC